MNARTFAEGLVICARSDEQAFNLHLRSAPAFFLKRNGKDTSDGLLFICNSHLPKLSVTVLT
jgi:hypothetical protein